MIRAYDVVDDGTKLANSRPFIAAEPGGTPDGFRLDVDGNLWCAWGMGNGKQDGVKPASHSLYSLYMNAQGAPGG